jgi:Second Messenger Oligonucleotide or Dinucleotide Synthetase domain
MDKTLSELYRRELYRTLLRPQTPLSAGTPPPPPVTLSGLTSPPPAPTVGALWPLGMLANPPHPAGILSALARSPEPPRANTLLGLSLFAPPSPAATLAAALATRPRPPQWIAVRPRFTEFHNNLALTPLQFADGMKKRAGVVSCLNNAYYGTSSETDNSFFVGSWAKNTATRPPRDVDVYFQLPPHVYNRFQQRLWNKQSALLQEVREQLAATYPDTDMRGDGQVVVVRFGTYSVEVVPAFALTTQGRYWICNTSDGGSYKETAPWAEVNSLQAADMAHAGNLRPLIRMLKAWQAWCSVDIKSFHLELLAAEFIAQSPWSLKDFFYFDWITRDFFEFLCQRVNGHVVVPGTGEVMALGDAWLSRAQSAHQRAIKACECERDNFIEAAGYEWQKIFGLAVPRSA